MLKDTGFFNVDFFWPRPNYRDPNMLIPLKNDNILRYWSNFIMTSNSLRQKLFKKKITTFMLGNYHIKILQTKMIQ